MDVLLDRLCLIKTRSQAGKACAEGRVFVNGDAARASKEVRVGDRVRYSDRLSRYEEEILVLEVPLKPVSKAVARECYERVARRDLDGLPSDERSAGESKTTQPGDAA